MANFNSDHMTTFIHVAKPLVSQWKTSNSDHMKAVLKTPHQFFFFLNGAFLKYQRFKLISAINEVGMIY
jgi:hypothetical protein